MQWFNVLLFLKSISIYICFCEIVWDKDKLTKAFVDDLIKLSAQQTLIEPVLTRIEKIAKNEYYLEVKVKSVGQHNLTEQQYSYLQCSGIVTDMGNIVAPRDTECTDFVNARTGDKDLAADLSGIGTGYTVMGEGPINLANEFQPSNITGSFVDLNASIAPDDVASFVVRQPDRHEPKARHSLNQVHHVKTQTQSRLSKINTSFVGLCVRYYNKIPDEIVNLPERKFKSVVKDTLIRKAYYELSQYAVDNSIKWSITTPAQHKVRENINHNAIDMDYYFKLAEESLAQYSVSSETKSYYKPIEINKVTNQLGAGTLTIIIFKASPTNCQVDYLGQPSSTVCKIQNEGEMLHCLSSIMKQPWASYKNITVSCSPVKLRQRRSLPGGMIQQNPNDTRYFRLVEKSLAIVGATDYTVIKVMEVSTQVLSGELLRIVFIASANKCTVDSNMRPSSPICEVENPNTETVCHLYIWDRPWLNEKDTDVKCMPNEHNRNNPLRNGNIIMGGVIPKDPNDPQYFRLAEEALAQYSISSKTKSHYKPIEIIKVTSQLVTGTLTKITFTASPTNCEVDYRGQPTSSVCEIQNTDQLNCFSAILKRPWLGRKDISVSCSPSKFILRNPLVGGQQIQDRNDPKYFNLAKESLTKYTISSGTNLYYEPTQILKVTTQVVSGVLTRIDFTASATNCVVDSTGQPMSSICNVKNPKIELTCHSRIWDQPWLNNKGIDIRCSPNVSGKKLFEAGLPGGLMPQNPEDPKYLNLAAESLKKAKTLSATGKHYKPTKILLVTTQVVSGLITRIDFIASATNCTVDSNGRPISAICNIQNPEQQVICHSQIWVQAWLIKKDIDIACAMVK